MAKNEDLSLLVRLTYFFVIFLNDYLILFFRYHLNYQHGISSITGKQFAQPTAERVNKKTGMKEALCHKCNKWILNQSPRDKDVLVPEIYW
jgi:hypothetical protein